VRDLWEIDETTAANVMRAAVRVAGLIRSALEPDGVNILHATGAVAFQTVFHFHLHVVPRTKGDRVKLPWIPEPGDAARIEEVSALIRGVPTI
jgi:histidine triad (HIT) family protein